MKIYTFAFLDFIFIYPLKAFNKYISFLFFFLYVSLAVFSQSNIRYGTPLYKNFSPEDYHSHLQVWSITQLNNGLMLLGTSVDGILFDGQHWQKTLKINTFPRIFFEDTISDKVYFGGDKGFGFFYFDKMGFPKEVLLSDSLPKEEKDYYTILSIVRKGKKIYFFGLKRIFIYENEQLITSVGTETDFRYAFTPDNKIFIRQTNVGLLEVLGDSLIKVPESDLFGKESVYFILPFDSAHYLLGAKNLGLFYFDKDYNTSQQVFRPLSNKIFPFLKKNRISTGILLHDGRLAIGTNLKGIVILNKDLTPHLFFSEKQGLINDNVNKIFQDRDHNLWIATNNGFTILYYGNPINKFYKKITNENSLIITLNIYKNKLFAGTMAGITRFDLETYDNADIPQNFMSVNKVGLKEPVIFLARYGNNFIASAQDGVYYFTDRTYPQLIDSNQMNFRGYFSRYDTNYFFNGALYGIDVFHKELGKWKKIGSIPLENQVHKISELKKGILFASTYVKGVYKIEFQDYRFPEKVNITHYYDTLRRFEDASIYFYKNRTLSFYDNKVYELNPDSDKFYDVTKQLIHFVDEQDTSKIPFSFTQDVLLPGHRYFGPNYAGTVSEILVTDSVFIVSDYPFRNIINTGFFQVIDDTARQCIWFTGPSGLYNYYYSNIKDTNISFHTFIHKVTIGKDSVIAYNGVHEAINDIPFYLNDIRFDFSALFFENTEKTRYIYFLKGFDKQWSQPTEETFTKYTNLPFGTYTFEVKAINVYGDTGIPASFTFTVLAPWYMKWWMFIVYVLMAILLIRFIILMNIRRLKNINIKLEKIIDERTKEIKEKSRDLEKKNELILNSIHYAKKIQDAIIPSENILQKCFPDSFIYFIPRDIVSGDFFWMHVLNTHETILALSDCTGHGVPGAFMSMIGNTLLNEIIKEKGIYDPKEILTQLHMGIVRTLQIDNEDNITGDGMDIVICKINTDKKTITIAGANQNVFLYTDDKLVDFTATIFSIGDPFARRQAVSFESNEFTYKKSFVLYLSSDGFYDQFGEKEGKKFSLKRFIQMLDKLRHLDADNQKKEIDKIFMNWKGQETQIDDVLMIGIKAIYSQ